LGDVILTTPLATDLKSAFPDARVDFMVGAAAAPLLALNPHIDEVVVFDPGKLPAMIRAVRERRYDWLVDTQVNPRTAILARLSGVPVRAGWNNRFWGLAYTHRTSRHNTSVYMVRNRQRLIELLGVPPVATIPRLYVSDAELSEGASELRSLGFARGRPAAAIALGTNEPARDWPLEGFAQVAAELERRNVGVVIFRFPGDAAQADAFRRHTSAGVFAPWRDDRRFLGTLAHCSVMISANTGPSHMALALGVPRVTIYGSTRPVEWSPAIPTAVALNNPAQACLDCGRKKCPLSYACIRGITPAAVVDATMNLLSAQGGV
jgi:ADP-heptose:LPS heptosyltransferase